MRTNPVRVRGEMTFRRGRAHPRSSWVRSSGMALTAILVMVSVVTVDATSALAAPPNGEVWPVCSLSRTTYCIESFDVNGTSAIVDPNWRLYVSSLDDRLASWVVQKRNGESWSPPPTADTVTFKLNLGLIEPVLTNARASDMRYLTGGNISTGYTIRIEARAVPTKWRLAKDEGDCGAGYCGTGTTRADSESTALYGATDTVPFWTLEDKQRFGGFGSASDAQSQYVFPLFSTYPFPHLLMQMANVHLGSDGSPVSGSFSAHLTPRILNGLGTTAAEAISTGLYVMRVEEAIGTRLASTVTASSDGGVDLQVPQVPYSNIQLWISGVDPGHPDGEPLLGQSWPVCHDDRQTFCAQSLEVNGVDHTADAIGPWAQGDWRANAYLLDRNSVNWSVERWDGQHWEPATDRNDVVKLSINTGNVRPLYTQAIAALSSFTTGGDATSGYTLAVAGSPAEIQWILNDGGACSHRGDCGGPTTHADTAGFAMSGNSQNLQTWDPSERSIFAGMWVATNAQYHSRPRFFPAALEEGQPARWQLRLGNPHLAKDEVRPVTGTYTAYVSPGMLAAMGTNAEEAADNGLSVHRTEGTSVTTLPMVITRMGEGVKVTVPSIGFSTPTITFTRTVEPGEGGDPGTEPGEDGDPRTDPGAAEGTPGELQEVRVDALDGAAAIRFQRPLDPGATAVTGYNLRCIDGDSVVAATAPRPVAVDIRPLANGQTWRCSARANNVQGSGPWSLPIEVTPTADATPIAPGAPVTMTARRRAGGSARISWSLPLSTGGAKITRYRVKVCASVLARCSVNATTRERTFVVPRGELKPRRYQVIVRAINRAGAGDPIRRGLAGLE